MKIKLKDDAGKEYEIEEIEEPTDVHDDDVALTPEEIVALKELAGIAPELKKLLEVEKAEHEATSDDETEMTSTEDEDEDIETKEEVVDTDSEKKPEDVKDSISKAAGKVEKRSTSDSIDNFKDCLEIENAWAKRFNGGTK